jgi:hypothetical protein
MFRSPLRPTVARRDDERRYECECRSREIPSAVDDLAPHVARRPRARRRARHTRHVPARASVCAMNCPSNALPRCHCRACARCATACSAASSKRSRAYACAPRDIALRWRDDGSRARYVRDVRTPTVGKGRVRSYASTNAEFTRARSGGVRPSGGLDSFGMYDDYDRDEDDDAPKDYGYDDATM